MARSRERSGEMMLIAISQEGDVLRVTTPKRRTSSGRLGSASATRFCTSTCAWLRSVPSLKVTVIVTRPSPVDWLDR